MKPENTDSTVGLNLDGVYRQLGRLLRSLYGASLVRRPELYAYEVERRGHVVVLRAEIAQGAPVISVETCLVRGGYLEEAHIDLLHRSGHFVLGAFGTSDDGIWFRYCLPAEDRLTVAELQLAIRCVASTAMQEAAALAIETGGMRLGGVEEPPDEWPVWKQWAGPQ